MIVYVIGSMRNPRIPEIGNALREVGHEVFEDWFSPGPHADDEWQQYEKVRGRSYREALRGYHARHVFQFDKLHLDRAHAGVLVMPAGRSAHIELGYLIGQNKPGFVLFDGEPERYDIMYQFATEVCFTSEELLEELKTYDKRRMVNLQPWNGDR